jgi:Nuclease-related domain
MGSRRLRLRRADVCAVCAVDMPAGSQGTWDPTNRTVTCPDCEPAAPWAAVSELDTAPLDAGQAAASAAREHRRRKSAREQRTQRAHPRLGRLLLALRTAPLHETAFLRGARGEQAVAEYLERRTAGSPTIILHDRRMPRGRGNIDHLGIAPAGVFIIDAKSHRGKVTVVTPIIGAPKLLVAGRDRTSLLDGLDRQVRAVRDALAAIGHPATPIHGVLCFTDADLPLLGTPTIRGHLLLHRKALTKRLTASGPLDPARIEMLAHALASALPPA